MEFLKQPEPMTLEGNISNQWTQFKEEFTLYAIASGCSTKGDEIKAATLLHCVGKRTREIIATLDITDEQKKKPDDIIKILDAYFLPKRNKTVERHKFNTRNQQPGEPFDNFIQDLRKIAADCEYGTMKDELLVDRLVCGICDPKITDRLLREENLQLEQAIKICKAAEQTEDHLKELQGRNHHMEVGAVKRGDGISHSEAEKTRQFNTAGPLMTSYQRKAVAASPRWNQFGRGPVDSQGSCNRCGMKHLYNNCPAYRQKCYKCNRLNHFAKQCRSRKINVVENFEIESDASSESFVVGNIETKKRAEEFLLEIKLLDCNKIVKFKLDTGAQVNVIPMHIFAKLNLNHLLRKCNLKITNYGGNMLTVKGECELNVLVNHQKYKLSFVIIETNPKSAPIIGISTIQDLNLINIKNVSIVSGVNKSDWSVVVHEYNDTFQGLGKIKINPYNFKLKQEYTPVIVPARKVPFQLIEPLKVELNKMIEDEIITPVSEATEFVNPIVLVAKKGSNKIRICLDPKNLNKAIQREHYKIPTFEELTHQIRGSKYFTILDANKGFWQILLNERASKLTTFATPHGRFRFLRLPFGLSCAPEIFQKVFAEIFKDIHGVGIYIDDIIIYANSLEEHNKILEKVLMRARENGVKFNKDKCKFAVQEITYIGHKLTQTGIKPDPHKIEAIKQIPPPQNKKELSRFLGMVTYVAKFIPNMAQLTSNLRLLLKKEIAWEWMDVQNNEFNNLKEILIKEPVLTYFRENEEITLSVDSSKDGMGAVILQRNQPVAYASKSLTSAQVNYAQIEKEALAILFGCQRFHQYLYGKQFIVETDHKPLESIFAKPLNNCPLRLQRILINLQHYDFVVKYKPGKLLYLADSLSRSSYDDKNFQLLEKEIELQLNLINYVSVSPKKFEEIKVETKKDPELVNLSGIVKHGWPHHKSQVSDQLKPYWNVRSDITEIKGVLYKGNQIIIPNSLRKEILNKLHYCHLGINKTLLRAQETVYWPFMTKHIGELVNDCYTCQKFQNSNQRETIINKEISNRPWQVLAADLFHFEGKEYLLIIDSFSKYPEIACLNNNTTSANVIQHFKAILARHGKPDVLFTDNGPQFVNANFQKFMEQWEITHRTLRIINNRMD